MYMLVSAQLLAHNRRFTNTSRSKMMKKTVSLLLVLVCLACTDAVVDLKGDNFATTGIPRGQVEGTWYVFVTGRRD